MDIYDQTGTETSQLNRIQDTTSTTPHPIPHPERCKHEAAGRAMSMTAYRPPYRGYSYTHMKPNCKQESFVLSNK